MTLKEPQIDINTSEDIKILPPYHVILLNDDDHSFEYVIGMLTNLFRITAEDAAKKAIEVHENGKSIITTTSKERAELKVAQIHSYGSDSAIANCKGPMQSVMEPAN